MVANANTAIAQKVELCLKLFRFQRKVLRGLHSRINFTPLHLQPAKISSVDFSPSWGIPSAQSREYPEFTGW
jgi:hypothetical protein